MPPSFTKEVDSKGYAGMFFKVHVRRRSMKGAASAMERVELSRDTPHPLGGRDHILSEHLWQRWEFMAALPFEEIREFRSSHMSPLRNLGGEMRAE